MVAEDLTLIIPAELISKAGILITILQALGIFVIFYIIFSIISIIIDRKRKKELMEMNEHLIEIKEILRRQKR